LTRHTLAQPHDRDQIWNVLEDLLVTTDPEGKYVNVNPAWATVLGWSEAELLVHVPEWLIHPDDLEKTRIELGRLASGHRTLRFENRLRHKTGFATRTALTIYFPGWPFTNMTGFMPLVVT
jgi:PAS domain S-box-containing protein